MDLTVFARRIVLARLTAFAVLAFAIAPAPRAFGEETAVKRIGVVSMVGDLLFERRLGVTAFGNKAEEYDVTDLGLDEAWEGKIEDYLSTLGGFEVVPLSVDRTPLIATYNKGTIVNNWRYLRFKKTQPIFAQIAADNRLDLLIVLGADAYDVVEGVMSIEGVGIFTSKKLGGANTIYYLIGQLALIDGATGKPIEKEYLTVGSQWEKGYGGFPIVEAPADLTGKPYTDYLPDERAALTETLSGIADNGWARSLSKLLNLPQPEDQEDAAPADGDVPADAAEQ